MALPMCWGRAVFTSRVVFLTLHKALCVVGMGASIAVSLVEERLSSSTTNRRASALHFALRVNRAELPQAQQIKRRTLLHASACAIVLSALRALYTAGTGGRQCAGRAGDAKTRRREKRNLKSRFFTVIGCGSAKNTCDRTHIHRSQPSMLIALAYEGKACG